MRTFFKYLGATLALFMCISLHAQREYLTDDFAGYSCGFQFNAPPLPADDRVFTIQQALESQSEKVVLSLRDAGMIKLDTVIPKLHLIKNLYALIVYPPTSVSPGFYCFQEAIYQHNLQVLTREIPLLNNLTYLSVCLPDSLLLSEIMKLTNLRGLLIQVKDDPIPYSINNLKNLETLFLLGNSCSFLDSVITLPKLRSLHMNAYGNCQVSNLNSLSELKDLSLFGDLKELPFLVSLSRLKKLQLVTTTKPTCVIPGGVEELLLNGPFLDTSIRVSNPTGLKMISISNPSNDDSLPAWVCQSTNVERLWINGFQVSSLSRAACNFKRLNFLVAYGYEYLTKENTTCFSEFKRLVFLVIIGRQNYSDSIVQILDTEHLQKCHHLKTLYLYNVALAESCGAEQLRCKELIITDEAFNASVNEIVKMKKLAKITILTWHGTDTKKSEELISAALHQVQIIRKLPSYYFSDVGKMFYSE